MGDVVAREVTVRGAGRSLPARLVAPTEAPQGTCPVVAFGNGFAQKAIHYRSLLGHVTANGDVAH